jgi:hypothetical protein
VWTTRAQNAVLVNGEGQKPHSADLGGRLVRWQLSDGFDYVLGDATAAYEGRLTRALRHVLFVKPGLIVLADELAAPQPSSFQWMLHGQAEFTLDPTRQRLTLDRETAGVIVEYAAAQPLALRQWTGYDPEPDHRYLSSTGRPAIPQQWHIEAAATQPAPEALTFTVIRPYRRGQAPSTELKVERAADAVTLVAGEITMRFPKSGPEFATIQAGSRTWKVPR